MSGTGVEPVSLYVHVPFCSSRCSYCDFYSQAGSSELYDRFVDAVVRHVGQWRLLGLLASVQSVYVGGGTPSVLGSGLVRLVGSLVRTLPLADDAEVTVEANPDSLDAELAGRLAAAGVTRVSLGVQSLDDTALAAVGRCHDAVQALSAAALVKEAGLALSVDLMCGVFGQRESSWMSTVLQAIGTGAEHVSVYPLTVEAGTALAQAVERGEVRTVDPDDAADQMTVAAELLEAAGLDRYEIANFARPGFESRHNLGYWTGRSYLGAGPSAASAVPVGLWERLASAHGWPAAPPGTDRVRFVMAADTTAYLTRAALSAEPEFLTGAERVREDVMLGMRLACGCPVRMVESAGLDPVFRELADAGLVELVDEAAVRVPSGVRGAVAEPGERWRLTDRGWLLGNEVFGRIWTG